MLRSGRNREGAPSFRHPDDIASILKDLWGFAPFGRLAVRDDCDLDIQCGKDTPGCRGGGVPCPLSAYLYGRGPAPGFVPLRSPSDEELCLRAQSGWAPAESRPAGATVSAPAPATANPAATAPAPAASGPAESAHAAGEYPAAPGRQLSRRWRAPAIPGRGSLQFTLAWLCACALYPWRGSAGSLG
jgi:hypothetical protein